MKTNMSFLLFFFIILLITSIKAQDSLHYIVIRDAPDGGGNEVTTRTMTTDEILILYAAGYDAQDNFKENSTVNWTLTGTLNGTPISDTVFVFDPAVVPTVGSIIATVDNMSDATGTIIVNTGELCFIIIRGTPCSVTIPFPSDNVCLPEYEDTTTAYVGDRMTFWAGAYDCEGNYRGDVHVDSWAIELTGTLKMENAAFIDVGQGRIILNGTDTSGVIIVTDNPASISTNTPILSQFKLEQAYPNPFNPSTTIQFYLPKSEHCKLEIYNSIGQIVETLIDWQMTAGEHKVQFNARHLSSGVYYYRLVTVNFTDVKKIILMK